VKTAAPGKAAAIESKHRRHDRPALGAPQSPDLARELHRLVTRIGLYAFAAGALSAGVAVALAMGWPR
jgi:hypothetical protein